MGEIFLARETNEVGVDRLVILKNLLPELAEQRSFVDAFLDEARVASTLSHPNIVSMYEVGSWKGVYYICMEYIEGDSLAGLLRRNGGEGIPPRVAARIIRDAAIGLSHAHEATRLDGTPLEVVHRDISPHNIMVRLDGVTKVVDFGIALARSRHSRTATGLIKGKLRYLAPEQLSQDHALDGRADQYALGAVFWELLTGRPLVDAPNDAMLIQALLVQRPQPPSASVRGLPREYDAIVMKMLASDRKNRFATCRDVATEIDQQIFASLQLVSSEDAVADFVGRLLGDELTARRRDLTPSRDFVLPARSFSEQSPGATVELRADEMHDARPAVESPGPTRVAKLARLGAIGLALATLVAALLLGRSDTTEIDPPTMATGDTPAAVAVSPAVAVVTSSPLGAVVHEAEQQLGVTPLTLELTATPRVLRLVAPGYASKELTLIADGSRTQTPHVVLAPLEASKAGSPTRSQSHRPPSKQTVERTGFLSVRTVPWTRISVGQKSYGTTPVVNIELPPGTHTLSLVNESRGVSAERKVEIRPGETTKLDLKLK